MLITRISRGAQRASLLARHKLAQNRFRISTSKWRSVRGLFLTALVARTVLMPVPLVAPATALAAGPDNPDPSPRVVRVSVETQEAIQLTRADEPTLTINQPVLQSITIGQSEADAALAAEAVAQAEAAAKAIAAKKAALVMRPRPAAYYGDGEVQQIIREAASKYGIDANLMLGIAKCESGFNPLSKNKHSSASGLFQFMPRTYANSPSGRAGLSIWDARANAEAAAFKIANGALRAWNASRSCWGR